MINIKKSQFVKLFENEVTIAKIGKIDINVIDNETYYSLYYKFPLIERLILEIYKSIPGANIEKYEQGVMKTINSIIKNNKKFNVIPRDLVDSIEHYFCDEDDSPRNIVFHENGLEEKQVTVNFDEINYIIASLLTILKHVSSQYNLTTLDKIEMIKG